MYPLNCTQTLKNNIIHEIQQCNHMYDIFLHMQHSTKPKNWHGFCTIKINVSYSKG